MELQDNANFDVQVYGFGCPALVSKDLAESADYITVSEWCMVSDVVGVKVTALCFLTCVGQTVVNDSDMVPRMSGISVANVSLTRSH